MWLEISNVRKKIKVDGQRKIAFVFRRGKQGGTGWLPSVIKTTVKDGKKHAYHFKNEFITNFFFWIGMDRRYSRAVVFIRHKWVGEECVALGWSPLLQQQQVLWESRELSKHCQQEASAGKTILPKWSRRPEATGWWVLEAVAAVARGKRNEK